MAASPRDRFDEIPDDIHRVGAHRGPKRRGRGWIVFAWAALASGLLVVVGLFGLSRYDSRFTLPLPFPAATKSAAPGTGSTAVAIPPVTEPGAVDPALNLQISVLNAGPTEGVQKTLAEKLSTDGWPVSGSANASTRTEKSTVVYYKTKDFEPIALGLVKILGVGSVQLSDSFPGAPVTIVLGADYKG